MTRRIWAWTLAGKGIIYLSESLSKIAYKRPDKIKLEVLSGREAGSNGFGFSFPVFINFYNNNVNALAGHLTPAVLYRRSPTGR